MDFKGLRNIGALGLDDATIIKVLTNWGIESFPYTWFWSTYEVELDGSVSSRGLRALADLLDLATMKEEMEEGKHNNAKTFEVETGNED